MIGQPLWKSLKSLVDLDKQISEVNSQIDQTEKLIQKDLSLIPQIEQYIKKIKEDLILSKKNLDAQELNAKILREKEVEKKLTLEKITDSKEYKALEKELKFLTGQILEQEEQLVKAWHQAESKEKFYNKEKEDKENQLLKLKEGLEVQNGSLKDILAKKEALLIKRTEATKLIPTEWLSKYERMIHKISDPIVAIVDDHCGACYYSILRQDLNILKKSGVLPCRNCYRLLYYDNQEEKQAKKEVY